MKGKSLHTPCFLPPVRLTLMVTPRVLGPCCCELMLQVLWRMKKLTGGVKWAFLSGSSSWGSSSHSGDGSQGSAQSSSFVPSSREIGGSICYPTHDDVPKATDGEDISIHCADGEVQVPPLLIVCSHFCLWSGLTWEGWFGWRGSHHPPDLPLSRLPWA
jgi:hypothetical protein